MPSRGCRPEDLNSDLWRYGPSYLRSPTSSSDWPAQPVIQPPIDPAERMERVSCMMIFHVFSVVTFLQVHGNLLFRYGYWFNRSPLDKLVRIMAFMLRVFLPVNDKPATLHLSVSERDRALNVWILLVQMESFPKTSTEAK